MAGKFKGKKPGLNRSEQPRKVRGARAGKLAQLRGKEYTATPKSSAFASAVDIAKSQRKPK
jgi:hypothetical protein